MNARGPVAHISFVEYQSTKGRDEALLRSLCADLDAGRLPDRPAYYATVLRRHLAGYPPPPKHRVQSRLAYWIAALYWLSRDSGDALAANHVAAWCRDRGIKRAAQSVQRAARSPTGRKARERMRESVAYQTRLGAAAVLEGHRIAVEERILAWHRRDDSFGIARRTPSA